jgi:hypothetical protein
MPQLKIQTAMNGDRVLIYSKDQTIFEQLHGNLAMTLIAMLDLRPQGDRVYVDGHIDEAGTLQCDASTLTRETQDW